MPDQVQPLLQVVAVTPNVDVRLCDIHTFETLIKVIAAHLSLDVTSLLASINEKVYIGANEPTGINKGKVWFKNDEDGAIGILIDGTYRLLTFPELAASDLPPQVPLSSAITFPQNATVPSGWILLATTQYPVAVANGWVWIQKLTEPVAPTTSA